MPANQWRDPEREGGWVPWLERLAPAVAERGVWHEYPMSSRGVAKQTAYLLRHEMKPRPPGRWEFTIRGHMLCAMYLGPGR